MLFNMNEKVKVKLTPEGHKILQDRHQQLVDLAPNMPEYIPPIVDENGWTNFQMWTLMQTFGSYIVMGMPMPLRL